VKVIRADTDPLSILVYLVSALQLASVVWVLWRRWQGGPVLFQFSRRWPVLLWLAQAWFVYAQIMLIVVAPVLHARTVCTFAQAGFLVMLFLPKQVRKRGLSIPLEFVTWDHVAGWSWPSPDTLSFRLNKPKSWERTCDIRVAPEKHEQLSAILDQFAPRSAEVTRSAT